MLHEQKVEATFREQLHNAKKRRSHDSGYFGQWLINSDLSYFPGEGEGTALYPRYIGMCGPAGYGFSAVLVINRVLILAILPLFKGSVQK